MCVSVCVIIIIYTREHSLLHEVIPCALLLQRFLFAARAQRQPVIAIAIASASASNNDDNNHSNGNKQRNNGARTKGE